MADTIINKSEPAQERVVEERPRSNAGVIIGIILIILVLLALFGGGLFRGSTTGTGTTGTTGTSGATSSSTSGK